MSVVSFGRVNLFKVGLLTIAVTLASCLVALAGTSGPAGATFPGSDGKILFTKSGVGGAQDIYVMNADGTGQVNLTNSPENDAEPDWSPYSQRIVFARSEGAQWDIYAMDDDGTGVTQLTSGSVFNLDPAWSPDGTEIAFVRGGATPSIYVMDADGTDQVQLTQPTFDVDPDWSPDGQKIAYSRAGDLYVMNDDGTNQVQRTSGSDLDNEPDWSPDGQNIAFERGDGNQYDVYVVNADGIGLTNLTNANPANDLEPSWSPDGTKIAFSSTRAGTNDIFVMNADGSGPTNRTSSANAGEVEADWGREDATAPTLNLPADITEDATSALGATVTFTPTATDDVDGSVPVNCSPASGSLFAIGTTQVNCSATDDAENQASGTFQVKVVYEFGNGSGGSFGEPVRDTELNQLAAGAGVPVKFGLGADYGLNIFATDFPASKKIDCSTGLPTDLVEETVAVTKSGLNYDATSGLYTYVWKTDKAWKGTCRELNLKLADGTDHRVRFQFK